MTDLEDLGPLQLSVRDFGPIAEADIELRPLTVFIGPSSTGKSYLATLIHALHGVFQDDGYPRGWRQGVQPSIYPDGWILEGEVVPFGDSDGWFDGISLDSDIPETWSSLKGATVPDSVSDNVHDLCVAFFQGTGALVAELERCFGMGTDIQNLIRNHGGEVARATLTRPRNDPVKSVGDVRFDFSVDRQGVQVSEAFLPHDSPFRIHMRGEGNVPKRSAPGRRSTQAYENVAELDWRTEVVYEILMSFTRDLVGPLSRPSYYLPADRAGVIHMNRAVVGLILRESVSRGRQVDIPTLTGIAVDLLAGLIEMEDFPQKRKGESESLATSLERDLLRGSVSVKSEGTNYPTFSYRPEGWERYLSLTNSASMVSDLTPLVLYLRHKIVPGDTLIVEEPEASLHPEAQAKLVIHLARLVHAGIRVIITTHSDWILEQFANLLRMSDLDENEREGLPGSDAVLTRDQFGAWMFSHDEHVEGTIVREIEFDPDEGGIVSGFGRVAEDLYNTWAEIGNRISDRKLLERLQ